MEAPKSFDAYDVIGIITPGTVVALLLVAEAPQFKVLLGSDGLSAGSFGLFVLLAFVLGHLVQAFGNLIEIFVWPICGLPTNRARLANQKLLTNAQHSALQVKVDAMEGGAVDMPKITRADWRAITDRAYGKVNAAGRSARIDVCNRNYGMCRGLVAAISLCLAWWLYAHRDQPILVVILAVMLIAAISRMRRAGLHYARKLFQEFIDLP